MATVSPSLPVTNAEILAAIDRLNDPHHQRHGSATYAGDCMIVAEWARKLYPPKMPPPIFTEYAPPATDRRFCAMVFCVEEIKG